MNVRFTDACMRRSSLNLSCHFGAFLLVAYAFVGIAQSQEEKAVHTYTGVKKCGMCHRSEKKGDQLASWEASAHAKAFETLKSEKARQFAQERGIETPPYQTDACLKCHVTGHGQPEDLFEKGFVPEQGVQCESCHGPGGDYNKMSVMKDREASIAAGLEIPTEETCTRCHNEESPGFTGFVYEEYLAKIAHPNPSKKGGE